jgi:hypothetical protein
MRPRGASPAAAAAALLLCFAALSWRVAPAGALPDDEAIPGLRIHSHKCSATCSYRTDSKLMLEEGAYAELLVKAVDAKGLGLVSPARKRATMLLTKAAVMSCVPGAIVETGVFTGGSSAVIMKTLMDMDECGRAFWAFDSFAGLPEVHVADTNGSLIQGMPGDFAATQEAFEGNLKALEAWDARIHVVKGWFNASIPPVRADIGPIAFLRLDGDMYKSTMDVLEALYDQLNTGALVYVDDYGSFTGCRRAVDEFRAARNIWAPLHDVKEPGGNVEAVWWHHLA